jgi:hypothetical protein
VIDQPRGAAQQISADVKPCEIHRVHLPRPVASELHHRFPKYLQVRAYGAVREHETVPICGTGHSDVHYAIDALLRGVRPPRGVGRRELAMAAEAVARYNAVRKP